MTTVIVTTFNRRDIVEQSIRSALQFVGSIGGNVVLVDDGSTDGTLAAVQGLFGRQIASGALRYIQHDANQGVTAAKNTGFQRADGDWAIFLDSDDTLIPEAAQSVGQFLLQHQDAPIVFFRCIDQAGSFVGRRFDEPQMLPLSRYAAHTSYGEALVAINKRMVKEVPFDADLRGYEGLGCARLIKRHGPGLLATIVARRYDRSRSDRLSSPRGFLERATLLARGHLRYISVCDGHISLHRRIALWIKAGIYYSTGRLYALVRSRHG